jgi:transcriptional regulator with XRE-family HTH domain
MARSDYINPPPNPNFDPNLASEKEVKAEFAKRVHHRMRQAGMTQSDLARATKIDRSLISNYIRGKTLPGDQKLTALCKVFGCQPDDLLPRAIIRSVDEDMPDVQATQDTASGMTRLRVNTVIPTGRALKILALIHDAD